MNSIHLERGKKCNTSKNVYLIFTKEAEMYWAYCEMPQYETTLAKDYMIWLEKRTPCTHLNGKGFIKHISNKDISFYFNLTDMAKDYECDLSNVKLEYLCLSFKHTDLTNAYDCMVQLKWFFKGASRYKTKK